jgi:hypothetical protein
MRAYCLQSVYEYVIKRGESEGGFLEFGIQRKLKQNNWLIDCVIEKIPLRGADKSKRAEGQ